MTDTYDVVVIGDGLAGKMAALAAADQGVSVGLLSDAGSPLRHSPGTIDLLGYLPGSDEPLADPFGHLDDLPAHHPYRLLGAQAIRNGLVSFDSVLGDAYAGAHTDANALVSTQLGTHKPVARYPSSFEPGLLAREADTLVVGFGNLAGFDGEFIADVLDDRVPYAVSGTNIDLAIDGPLEHVRLRLATALDRNERWPGDRPIRTELTDRINPRLEGESRIGLPAILGRDDVSGVRADLESELGIRVFEIPTDPPSLPGIRIDETLEAAIRSRGIDHRTPITITDIRSTEGSVTAILPAGGSAPIEAREFVLATGGLAAGGLLERSGRIVEPVFDLPTNAPRDRDAWWSTAALGPQPFDRFGVSVDSSLRPVAEPVAIDGSDRQQPLDDRNPVFDNVRACGSIIGGFDPLAEHSSSGVAVATGDRAGRLAATAVMDG